MRPGVTIFGTGVQTSVSAGFIGAGVCAMAVEAIRNGDATGSIVKNERIRSLGGMK